MTADRPLEPLSRLPFPLVPADRPQLAPRPADGHKGTFGKVLIVGGSNGMSGAVCLASVAALRSGSGLVTAMVPASIQAIVAGFEPCVMTVGLACHSDLTLVPPGDDEIAARVAGRNAIAVGPGLGRSDAAAKLLKLILRHATCPLILDADALNLAAEHELLSERRPGVPVVLTPHAGEFARLAGCRPEDFASCRESAAAQFAQRHQLIVVLKGPGTIVTDGHRAFRNTTGNAGLATGGSGDVLTGVIASLAGQGLPLFEAAALGVYVHGLAGDLAAAAFTQRGMIASDLLSTLPQAWRRLESD